MQRSQSAHNLNGGELDEQLWKTRKRPLPLPSKTFHTRKKLFIPCTQSTTGATARPRPLFSRLCHLLCVRAGVVALIRHVLFFSKAARSTPSHAKHAFRKGLPITSPPRTTRKPRTKWRHFGGTTIPPPLAPYYSLVAPCDTMRHACIVAKNPQAPAVRSRGSTDFYRTFFPSVFRSAPPRCGSTVQPPPRRLAPPLDACASQNSQPRPLPSHTSAR